MPSMMTDHDRASLAMRIIATVVVLKTVAKISAPISDPFQPTAGVSSDGIPRKKPIAPPITGGINKPGTTCNETPAHLFIVRNEDYRT